MRLDSRWPEVACRRRPPVELQNLLALRPASNQTRQWMRPCRRWRSGWWQPLIRRGFRALHQPSPSNDPHLRQGLQRRHRCPPPRAPYLVMRPVPGPDAVGDAARSLRLCHPLRQEDLPHRSHGPMGRPLAAVAAGCCACSGTCAVPRSSGAQAWQCQGAAVLKHGRREWLNG